MEKEPFIAFESGISPGGLLVRKHSCLGMRRRGKKTYGTYIMPRLDGGVAEDGKRYKKNAWDGVYKVLSENQIDVEGYVEFVFSRNATVASPNILKSPSLLEKYKKELQREEPPSLWDFEINRILTEITLKVDLFDEPAKAFEYVLLDDTIQVTPLTRYAYGVGDGMEYIVRPLEEEAFKQYFEKRYFYERYYKDRIPENLRKRAESIDESCEGSDSF